MEFFLLLFWVPSSSSSYNGFRERNVPAKKGIALEIVTCTQAQPERAERKSIESLSPLRSLPFRDSRDHRKPHTASARNRKPPVPLLPRPRSLHAAAQRKARRTNAGERRNNQNKWFYPSNVRRGEWGLGTNNQHRNRNATCRNVRPTGILFAQGKKGVIFFGVDRPQQVVPSGKKTKENTGARVPAFWAFWLLV